MSRPRILSVTRACYLDDSSGAAVALRALVGYLARQGFSTEALCGSELDLGPGRDFGDWLAERGHGPEADIGPVEAGPARHLRLNVSGVSVTILGGVPPSPLGEDGLRREFLRLFDDAVARSRPDLLVTYGGDPLTREILARARRLGILTVFTLHNCNYHDRGPFADADLILVPSRFAADHYRETLGLSCTVLPNLIDPERVRSERAGPGYVTFVNPSPEKGVFAFARIADELGRRRPDIPLLIVESRGTEETLAACGIDLRRHGSVSVMGHTPDPRQFWGVTRVCLMPSLWRETQGLVAVEAMINGIPVIGSDRGALPETLGQAGIVLPLPQRLTEGTRELPTAEEVAPWVEAVIRLWDDPDLHEGQRRRALEEARRWDPDVLGPQFVRLFSEARPRPRPVAGTPTPQAAGTPARPTIEAGLAAIAARWPDLRNPSDDDPVFVLSGGWRSGSTMLQRLIVRSCFLWGEPFGHAGLIDSMADPIRCFTGRWPEDHHFYQGTDPEVLSRRFIANLYPSIQDLLEAHQAYFSRLLAEPARRAGASRWGLKEVRLSVDHALYLKWLFPRARFVFLIRNPYDAWKSYAARAAKGWRWYKHWPDEPVTVRSFAAHWRDLVTSFLDDHRKVDGLVVRYEDLKRGDYGAIADYLGFPVSEEAGRVNPSDGGPPPLKSLSESDRAALDKESGVLARSLGYTERTESSPPERPGPRPVRHAPQPAGAATADGRPNDPSRCVILVPVGGHIEPACDEALRALERRGYTVRRVRGYSAIDQGRNQIATNALRDGFDELMWIDSDVAFEPDAVDRLRSHGLPITCGVYPKKGKRSFACNFPGSTRQIPFGKEGGLVEIPYAGAGFLHTRREAYQAVQERFRLPPCNERFGPSMIPFFQPTVIPDGAGHWYLAEDYAFCHRARECGYRIMADTTIRLKHIGSYAYSWEDAGGERPRYANFTFHITD